jgi:basic membrane protein A
LVAAACGDDAEDAPDAASEAPAVAPETTAAAAPETTTTAEPEAPAEATTTMPDAPTEVTDTPSSSDGAGLRVAFLFDGTIDQGGWNGSMHRGQQYLEQEMPGAEVIAVEDISPGQSAQRAMSDLAEDGYHLIVGTSTFDADMAIVAAEYPETGFLHACDATVTANMGQFCLAVEEARYVDGALAAMLSETGTIGYVAGFPIFFVLKPLNLFVAGARSVNPDAEVHVVFTNNWFDPNLELQAANALIDLGADVLTYDLSSSAVPEVAAQRGVGFIGYGYDDARIQAPDSWIGGSLYNWGPAFVTTAQDLTAGTWEPGYVYGGYADGLLGYAEFGPTVPAEAQDAVNGLIADIVAGDLDVFAGPLVDRDGNSIVSEGEALDFFARAVCCDWVIDGVHGEIG